MFSRSGRLLTGTASKQLQLWTVGETTDPASPPPVTLAGSMELDGGAFSSAFDSKTELVRFSFSPPLPPPSLFPPPLPPLFPSLPPPLMVSHLPQGVVGTTAGTVWYINWPEESSVKLVSGHADQVSG